MDDVDRLVHAVSMPAFHGEEPPAWVLRALDDGLAGVCLYGHNLRGPDSVPRAAGAVRDVAPDALVALDEEGGDVTRLDYLTGSRYPGPWALGVVDDPDLTREVAAAVAADLRAVGVNLDLAPSVDVGSDPRNPVIGVRSFGPDPERVSVHGAAFVAGLQAGGVAASVKHFPGHGDTDTDSHLALPVVEADEETYRRRDLPPFAAAVRAGVATVMTSHVVVRALDDQPATLSRRLLTGLLREEMGFDGVVISDALDMAGVRAQHGIVGAGVLALAAGADLLLLGAEDGRDQLAELGAAVRSALADGRLGRDRLEEAAARVDLLRKRLVAGDLGPTAPAAPAGADVGPRAARRALRSSSPAPVVEVARRPVVAELRGEQNMAVGHAPWGAADPLRRRGSDVQHVAVHETGPAPEEVLALAADRPLLLVVRDAYRRPWQRDWVRTVVAARPDAVLLGLGMPHDVDLAGDAWLLTHSASRVSTDVALDALLR
ncbi:glycoside hydrolase family 3 protein [Thalassiella azotivora]